MESSLAALGERRLRIFHRLAAGSVAALGGVVLIGGWGLGVDDLKNVLPGAVTMKANTALGLLLAGASLHLAGDEGEVSRTGARLSRLLAAVTAMLGGMILIEYFAGLQLGFDELLTRDDPDTPLTSHPGRPAVQTALGFLLIGVALVWIERRWAEWLALSALVPTFAALIGYLYGVPDLVSPLSATAMAVHTSGGILVLSLGVLLARPRRGWMGWITGPGIVGMAARTLLPASLATLLGSGLLIRLGRLRGYYGDETEPALHMLAATVLMVALIFVGVRSLAQVEAERLRTIADLAEHRARLAAIVESAMDAILTIDEDQRIVLFNTAAERMFGCSKREAIGTSIDRFVPEEFRERHRALVRAFRQRGETSRRMGDLGSLTALRADGERFPIEASISTVRVGEENLGTVILRDVSERQRAERRAAWLASYPERNPNPIVELDPVAGRIVYANPTVRASFPDLLERGLEHPFLSDVAGEMSAMVREGQGAVKRRDITLGGTSYLRILDHVPGTNSMRIYAFDITERQRMEEALREREAEFRGTFYFSPIGKALAEPGTGIVRRVNERFEQITGLSMEGLTLAAFGLSPSRDGASGSVDSPGRPREHRLVRSDGAEVWTLLRTAPIRGANGEVLWILLVIEDVTEQKRALEEVRRLSQDLERRVVARTAQLEQANRELEAFSYSVSHDLRAPLRAVDGFSQAVLEECGAVISEDGKHYLTRIRQGAQRMSALIDDLLAFSRLGRQPLRRVAIDPAEIVRASLDDLRWMSDGRRVEVNVGDLPRCHADPALLQQVFLNLLSNALKYTRERDVAHIEVGAIAGDPPAFFVRDDGTGFDMRYADKIYGVFQRLHRAEEYEGTGVGLALVQRIVHRHGGRIWAEAEIGRGATFFFTVSGDTEDD